MLMETVADPRRANWLTITSMSEDLCWPEDNGTSRPSWELEAEILRLTTRLMMRERELRQMKTQLKAQTTKTQQQAAYWRRTMEEKEEQMRLLLLQKDAEMQAIVSQLLLFEAELRQEQSRIEDLLEEKDSQIARHQEEMFRLQQRIGEITSSNKNSAANQEDGGDISNGNAVNDRLQRLQKSSVTANCDINPDFYHLSQDSAMDGAQVAVRKIRDGVNKIRVIQDVTNVRSMGERAVDTGQICENLLSEKKRVSYRAPQKMKDLKAKRINSHKMYRPVVNDICTQAIL